MGNLKHTIFYFRPEYKFVHVKGLIVCLQMQELENENDKLKREVSKLMTSIAGNTNFDTRGRKISPAGKEFLGKSPLVYMAGSIRALS